jgi:hypothetical protein
MLRASIGRRFPGGSREHAVDGDGGSDGARIVSRATPADRDLLAVRRWVKSTADAGAGAAANGLSRSIDRTNHVPGVLLARALPPQRHAGQPGLRLCTVVRGLAALRGAVMNWGAARAGTRTREGLSQKAAGKVNEHSTGIVGATPFG